MTNPVVDVLRIEELVLPALLVLLLLVHRRVIISMSRIRVANGEMVVVVVHSWNSRARLGERGVARSGFESRASCGSVFRVGIVKLGDGDVEHTHEGLVLAVGDLCTGKPSAMKKEEEDAEEKKTDVDLKRRQRSRNLDPREVRRLSEDAVLSEELERRPLEDVKLADAVVIVFVAALELVEADLKTRTHEELGVFELDVVLVVHETLKTLVVLLLVLLVLLRLDGVDGGLVGEVGFDRDVTGVEDEVLAILQSHVLRDDDDGLWQRAELLKRKGRRKGKGGNAQR